MNEKAKLMVVEDDWFTAQAMKQKLESYGYEVSELVSTGEEAVEKALAEQPDLILMDIRLAGKMDGIDAAGHIHARSDIPVLFSTAHAESQLVDRAKTIGPLGYLVKPCDDRTLRIGIEIALSRDKKETQLRQIGKKESISNLAGGLTHKFNNLLSVILGNTELAMDGSFDLHNIYSCLEEVMAASIRARDVVRELMTLCGRCGGGQDLMPIFPLVKRTIETIRSELSMKVRIGQSLETTRAMVMINADRMREVLSYLCENAIEAMASAEGVLTIGLKVIGLDKKTTHGNIVFAPGEYVRIDVGDTGKGMSRDILERIFDPYFTTKENAVAAGLSLAIARGIVEEFRGAIWAESRPGRGAVFSILIPAAKNEEAFDPAA